MAPSCHSFGTARSQLSTKTVCAMECSYQAESALPVLGAECLQRALQLHRCGAPESCAVGITELMQVVRALLPRGDQIGGSDWSCQAPVHTLFCTGSPA